LAIFNQFKTCETYRYQTYGAIQMNKNKRNSNNPILAIVLASALTFSSGITAVSLAFQPTLSPEQKQLCQKSAEVFKVGGLTLLELLKNNKRKSD